MPKPNFVLFMVDQLSMKWLDAAWRGVCPVPNLTRLRERGTLFTNALTSNPVCCPTRATLATGLTTRGHGVLENGYALDPELPTFMHALQRAGWRTGALGKVHFLPHFAGLYPDYKPYGFDVTHITEDARGGEWLDWVATEHPQHYEAVLATIWPSHIPEYAAYGPDKRDLGARIRQLRQTFQWKTDEYPQSNPGRYVLPFPEEVSQTNWITGHALDFIRETPADQPLFAHVSYVQPHSPFCSTPEYLRQVDREALPEPVPAEWVNDPHAPKYFADKQPRQDKDYRWTRQCYFADVSHLDRQLGRVVEVLEETGRLDNTYLFFLSDHGELLGDHGFFGKEERHYDACLHVPLIICGPGVQPGQVCDQPVQHEDFCPTVLDLAGLTPEPLPKTGPYLHLSADEIPVLPGRSLRPLCQGESVTDWRQAAYCESYNPIWSADPGDWARTIRTRDFRYTCYPHGGAQLFDLRNDPDEQNNLVNDLAYAGIRQGLRDQLFELVILQDYPKTRRDLFALGVH